MGSIAGLMALTMTNAAGGAVAQRRQASAVVDQADFESQVDAIAARDAIAAGATAAQRRAAAGRQAIGAQRAALGASGVDVNSGTAADLQAQEASLSELDQQMIRNNAAREAWGYTTQGELGRISARNEAANLRLQAGATLLTGAVQSANIYGSRNTRTPMTVPRTANPLSTNPLPAVARRVPGNTY